MDLRLSSFAALTVLSIPCMGAISDAQSLIAAWPEHSRVLAEEIVQEYGTPDVVEPAQLSWTGRRPWISMVVYRAASASGRPSDLQQSVSYDVPVGRWRALGAFDRGVEYDPVARELIARGGDESANILALNLADEVIRGRRTAAEAAEFYDKTLSLSLSGKNSPYMRKLRFRPQNLPERFPSDGIAVRKSLPG
ncbi:MAG: hypothetical protein ACHQ2Z_11300 [Elusimicrobiota bacterium]